jgi:DNA-binding transcriptional ArsR family regulator
MKGEGLLSSSEGSGYERLSSILNALGDTTALKILNEADKGFSSGNEVIDKLGLTPRKYYRYLKKLREQGIIACSGSDCCLTPLGKRLHNLVFNHALSLLSTNLEQLESVPKVEWTHKLEIINDYKELVKLLNGLIEKSKNEIFFASKYLDFSVGQNIMLAFQRHVKFKAVISKRLNFSGFLKILASMARDIRPNSLYLLFRNMDTRMGDVPLSFVVIDNEIAVFEIPSEEFKIAFYTVDKKIVDTLSEFFLGLWNNSKKSQIRLNFTKNEG